jgi:hypothetical protein
MESHDALEEIRDWLGIRRVTALYARAMDDGDPSRFADVFVDDGVMEVTDQDGARRVHAGRAEIAARAQHPHNHFVHMTLHPIIEVSGDVATQECTLLLHDMSAGAGKLRIVTGRYSDTLVRTERGWLFKRRVITLINSTEAVS